MVRLKIENNRVFIPMQSRKLPLRRGVTISFVIELKKNDGFSSIAQLELWDSTVRRPIINLMIFSKLLTGFEGMDLRL